MIIIQLICVKCLKHFQTHNKHLLRTGLCYPKVSSNLPLVFPFDKNLQCILWIFLEMSLFSVTRGPFCLLVSLFHVLTLSYFPLSTQIRLSQHLVYGHLSLYLCKTCLYVLLMVNFQLFFFFCLLSF